MKTNECLQDYKRQKDLLREWVKKLMFGRMVIHNLDFLPNNYSIKISKYIPNLIEITPPVKVDADVFRRVTKKISKYLRNQPSMEINKESMSASWIMWFEGSNYVHVAFTTDNTEACDVTYHKEEAQVPELTGFCKQIKEAIYYDNSRGK